MELADREPRLVPRVFGPWVRCIRYCFHVIRMCLIIKCNMHIWNMYQNWNYAFGGGVFQHQFIVVCWPGVLENIDPKLAIIRIGLKHLVCYFLPKIYGKDWSTICGTGSRRITHSTIVLHNISRKVHYKVPRDNSHQVPAMLSNDKRSCKRSIRITLFISNFSSFW
jgi:hypothetical protein